MRALKCSVLLSSSFGFTNEESITIPAIGFVDNLQFLRKITEVNETIKRIGTRFQPECTSIAGNLNKEYGSLNKVRFLGTVRVGSEGTCVQYIINVIVSNASSSSKEFFSSDRVDCNKVDFEQMRKQG